jgi:putative redox protein
VDGHEAYSDAKMEKGGGDAGFGPHALLEASVGCCVNIWLRMYADKNGIPLSGVTVMVQLNRRMPDQTIVEYAVKLKGSLTPRQRQELHQQVVTCPVSRTLLKRISFRELGEEEAS